MAYAAGQIGLLTNPQKNYLYISGSGGVGIQETQFLRVLVGKKKQWFEFSRSLFSPPLESEMENTKIERDGRGEKEEDDRKMEEFFALIRSFREARNRRKEELREMEEMKMEKEKKKRMRRSGEEQSRWIPTFRREDFTEEIQFQRPPMIFASPCNKKNQREDNLDLNLRL